jgi:hypothetical protein
MPEDVKPPVSDPAVSPLPAADPSAPPPAPVTPPTGGDPTPKPTDPPTPPAPTVPDKYDLKLPDKSTVDKAVVERTAAKARELGLSQEHAQKTLDYVHQEIDAAANAAVEASLKSHLPGGAVWEQQVTEWGAASLADPEIGNNNPEQMAKMSTLAKEVVAKFGDKESIEFIESNPLSSHPAFLRLLTRIGKASAEGSLVVPSSQRNGQKSVADRWYAETTGT